MEINFVSDISTNLYNLYNENTDYEGIYDELLGQASYISDPDNIYRLQQDIASLNNSLALEISQYINNDIQKKGNRDYSQGSDTLTFQSESLKTNLIYKYFYLIMKFLVFVMLLIWLYFNVFSRSASSIDENNIIPTTL